MGGNMGKAVAPAGRARMRRGEGRPFQAGKSGNPAGRPHGALSKITKAVRQVATELVDNPTYRRKLKRDLERREVPPLIEQMLWHYAKGKPKDIVEMEVYSGTINLDLVNTMSTEELEAARTIYRKLLGTES